MEGIMNRTQADPIFAATTSLRQKLAADADSADSRWVDVLHDGLAKMSDAIQKELHAAERSREQLGEVNRDFQNVPVTDRMLEATRSKLIQIGEQVHQFRADLRNIGNVQPLDVVQLRLRCEDILDKVEEVRHEDDRMMLEAVNSNPGAGE
jgi:hypothetical protein